MPDARRGGSPGPDDALRSAEIAEIDERIAA